MNLSEFLDHVNRGEPIGGGTDLHRFMHDAAQDALRTVAALNAGYHTPEEVRALLSRLTGRTVDETVTVFPPGSFVELSDGSFGLVIKTNSQERLRPVIMLYERNASHDQAAIIDLARERSISIEKSLDPKTLPERVKNALLPTQLNGYLMTEK